MQKQFANKWIFWFGAALVLTGAAFVVSLCVGRFPLSISDLLTGQELPVRVFWTLRLPRTLMAVLAGFVLGVAGSVYQTVFQNPLASPDIIGVSSGATVGAACAILFFGGGMAVTAALAFVSALVTVFLTLGFSRLSGTRRLSSVVLSGIAVNAVTQAILMLLKLSADPQKHLGAIEYWVMGTLSDMTASKLPLSAVISLVSTGAILLLHRQLLLLSLSEEEAGMLGVSVEKMRFLLLVFATLAVASIVSVTGLISFVGLLAPHVARLLTKDFRLPTMVFGGILGSLLLLLADLLARSIGTADLPLSIFTSFLGAPFLLFLVLKGGKMA